MQPRSLQTELKEHRLCAWCCRGKSRVTCLFASPLAAREVAHEFNWMLGCYDEDGQNFRPLIQIFILAQQRTCIHGPLVWPRTKTLLSGGFWTHHIREKEKAFLGRGPYLFRQTSVRRERPLAAAHQKREPLIILGSFVTSHPFLGLKFLGTGFVQPGHDLIRVRVSF